MSGSPTLFDTGGGGGSSNPLTTTGDIIIANPNSTQARLPIGSVNQVLTVIGGLPSWQAAASGAPAFNAATKTANYTLVAGDAIAANASAGSFTLTFPDASTNAGKPIKFYRKDSTPKFLVTVTCAGSDTFYDGNTSIVLNDQGSGGEWTSIGTVWFGP